MEETIGGDRQIGMRFRTGAAAFVALWLGCWSARAQEDRAPEFSITTDRGARIGPRSFGGSLLVLNFWETACVPCVKELPSLGEFVRQFRPERVVVVAVSGDEDGQKYQRFLRDHRIELETYRDGPRRISKSFGTLQFPETYLIQDGRIVRKVVGAIDWMGDEITAFVRSRLGESAYTAFLAWRNAPENRDLKWEAATAKYSALLIAGGMKPAEAARTVSIVTSRDEGAFYDSVYANPSPKFLTTPNKLLMEAVAQRKPGRALDVGMGQGRNALYLARLGWDVTGFDPSKTALEQAQKAAAAEGLALRTVLASDEEFDFGTEKWDLIAILYPIEKRSVYRVRQALKRGGLVVVECSHKEGSNKPFEYDTNELLKIFDGFRIVKYQDAVDEHEWVRKPLRLVRLIAEK